MKWNADHLPDDVEQLKQLLQQQQLEIEKYAQLSQQAQDQLAREKQQHNKTQTRLAAIEEQLRLLLHKRFGRSCFSKHKAISSRIMFYTRTTKVPYFLRRTAKQVLGRGRDI